MGITEIFKVEHVVRTTMVSDCVYTECLVLRDAVDDESTLDLTTHRVFTIKDMVDSVLVWPSTKCTGAPQG